MDSKLKREGFVNEIGMHWFIKKKGPTHWALMRNWSNCRAKTECAFESEADAIRALQEKYDNFLADREAKLVREREQEVYELRKAAFKLILGERAAWLPSRRPQATLTVIPGGEVAS